MSDPFLGEIRAVGFNFAPTGWAVCDGQVMPISQNTALFSLLGTTYGGDGRTTFALPDLQGAFCVGSGQGPGLSDVVLGEEGGSEMVSLISAEMPAHTHTAMAVVGSGDQASPNNAVWAQAHYGRTLDRQYAASPSTTMSPAALAVTGGNLPHNNMSPYLTVTYIIALQGIFPPRG